MKRYWLLIVGGIAVVVGGATIAYGSHLEGTFPERVMDCIESNGGYEIGSGAYVKCESVTDGEGVGVAGRVLLGAGAAAGTAGILLLLQRKRKAQRIVAAASGRTCPFCAEVIQPEAVVCRYCGRDLTGDDAVSHQDGGRPE